MTDQATYPIAPPPAPKFEMAPAGTLEKASELTEADLASLGDIGAVARTFVSSGMFPTIKSVAQASVKIMAGRALGISDFEAMSSLDVMRGVVRPRSKLLGSLIRQHDRYDYRLTELSDQAATCEILRDGEVAGAFRFTMEMARRAGLAGKDTYKQYPEKMLAWRAIGTAADLFAPDVTKGIPSELAEDPPAHELREATERIRINAVSVEPPSNVTAGDPTPDSIDAGGVTDAEFTATGYVSSLAGAAPATADDVIASATEALGLEPVDDVGVEVTIEPDAVPTDRAAAERAAAVGGQVAGGGQVTFDVRAPEDAPAPPVSADDAKVREILSPRPDLATAVISSPAGQPIDIGLVRELHGIGVSRLLDSHEVLRLWKRVGVVVAKDAPVTPEQARAFIGALPPYGPPPKHVDAEASAG